VLETRPFVLAGVGLLAVVRLVAVMMDGESCCELFSTPTRLFVQSAHSTRWTDPTSSTRNRIQKK
jgi:hypothetical protein